MAEMKREDLKAIRNAFLNVVPKNQEAVTVTFPSDDFHVVIKKGSPWTTERKEQMTTEIFHDEEVLQQLELANRDREQNGFANYIEDEDEFMMFVAEVQNGKQKRV